MGLSTLQIRLNPALSLKFRQLKKLSDISILCYTLQGVVKMKGSCQSLSLGLHDLLELQIHQVS